MNKVTQLIYTSVLSSASHVTAISSILRGSRARNREAGITGVLLFDGHHFCGWVEGAANAVNQLHRNLQTDERHADFHVMHHWQSQSVAMFSDWSVGYSHDCANSLIPMLSKTPQAIVVGGFKELMRSFEIA